MCCSVCCSVCNMMDTPPRPLVNQGFIVVDVSSVSRVCRRPRAEPVEAEPPRRFAQNSVGCLARGWPGGLSICVGGIYMHMNRRQFFNRPLRVSNVSTICFSRHHRLKRNYRSTLHCLHFTAISGYPFQGSWKWGPSLKLRQSPPHSIGTSSSLEACLTAVEI